MTTAARLLLSAVVLAPVLAVSAACNVRAPNPTRADPFVPSQVNVANRVLAGRLAWQPPEVSRDEAGLLFVNVGVRSTAARPQIIQYRFRYFDEAGQGVGDGAWQTRTLEANTFENIRGNSTTARAEQFRLDVREAR